MEIGEDGIYMGEEVVVTEKFVEHGVTFYNVKSERYPDASESTTTLDHLASKRNN